MDNPTESYCDCLDCSFVKYALLQKMINHHYLPIKLSFKIGDIYTAHVKSNAIFPSNSVVYVLIHQHEISSKKRNFTLIIKILRNQNSEEARRLFQNEVQFYNNIRYFVRYDLFPKCYLANISNELFQHPVIVLENLIAKGYTKQTVKLDEKMLCEYMKILGLFHALSFRMQMQAPKKFKCILESMRLENGNRVKVRQEEAVSDFLNSPILDALISRIRQKIIQKLKKVKHLQSCSFSTLIHGCFTRDAVLLKDDKNMRHWKIIDFKKVQYAPPVIDFGRLLLTNLPNTYCIVELESFRMRAMHMYVMGLIEEYPGMIENVELLKREIYNNLLFSYVNLEIDERKAIENHLPILHLLNYLCIL